MNTLYISWGLRRINLFVLLIMMMQVLLLHHWFIIWYCYSETLSYLYYKSFCPTVIYQFASWAPIALWSTCSWHILSFIQHKFLEWTIISVVISSVKYIYYIHINQFSTIYFKVWCFRIILLCYYASTKQPLHIYMTVSSICAYCSLEQLGFLFHLYEKLLKR